MDKIADEEKVLSINRLRPLLAIWFFAGMPLNMLLSWLYFFVGGTLPGVLFLLSSLVYLSGGLLGTLWSLESLRKQTSIRWDSLGALLVLIVSVGFLYLGVLFALDGLRRL